MLSFSHLIAQGSKIGIRAKIGLEVYNHSPNSQPLQGLLQEEEKTCLYFQDIQSEILVKNTYTIHANALGI